MFGGIVEYIGVIVSIDSGTYRIRHTMQTNILPGQSIAHDGACMTVKQVIDEQHYEFFIMEESLRRTSLGDKQIGNKVNLLLPITMTTLLDGHMLSGHIDTTWSLDHIDLHDDGSRTLYISCDSSYRHWIIPKWSIALDGVSLTVVSCTVHDIVMHFTVCMIPYTRDYTCFHTLIVWSRINIEFDMIGKYVSKTLDARMLS